MGDDTAVTSPSAVAGVEAVSTKVPAIRSRLEGVAAAAGVGQVLALFRTTAAPVSRASAANARPAIDSVETDTSVVALAVGIGHTAALTGRPSTVGLITCTAACSSESAGLAKVALIGVLCSEVKAGRQVLIRSERPVASPAYTLELRPITEVVRATATAGRTAARRAVDSRCPERVT